MLGRLRLMFQGNMVPASAGNRAFDGSQVVAYAGNAVALTPSDLMAGIIDSTATAAATHVLPSTDAIVAACPDLSVGDSFKFSLRQLAAFTTALTAGAGMTLVGVTTIAASFCRDYLVTILSNARAAVYAGNTVNGNAVVLGMTTAQLAALQVGMAVTGTGIAGSTTIVAINLTGPAPSLTLSANATATNNLVALTFSPTCTVKGLGTYGL